MNSFFASVEQQERPRLRGQPVAVVPVLADSTCCIAASYEAKGYGVQTGTQVREARRLCPHLHLIEARVELYVKYHYRIVEAVTGEGGHDLNKLGGLSMILPSQMPEAIGHLKLTDLPGIAVSLARRLHAGITTVAQQGRAAEADLAGAWGSKVLGTIWWAQRRRRDLPYRKSSNGSTPHYTPPRNGVSRTGEA